MCPFLQAHLKILEYHCRLFWNLDLLCLCLVFVWVCSAWERLLEVSLQSCPLALKPCIKYLFFLFECTITLISNVSYLHRVLNVTGRWIEQSCSSNIFLLGKIILYWFLKPFFGCFMFQGRLCVLLLVSCMEKVLLCIMMRKGRMACLLDYQSMCPFPVTIFSVLHIETCFSCFLIMILLLELSFVASVS